MAIPTTPMAAPRFSGGKIDNMTVWFSGIETPTPIDWITRPVKRRPKFGAVKAMIVPIKNVAIAEMYITREFSLLINQAEIGIMIPVTSMKLVVNH